MLTHTTDATVALDRGAFADLDAGRRVFVLALAVLFVATAARLAVPVPLTPVPVSLQDLAVLLVGVVLGPLGGGAALVTYLVVGALGAPVFSMGQGGLPWLFGPTGGYLLAYPMAATIMGAFAVHSRRVGPMLVGALAAQAVVYLGGVGQLLLLTGQGLSAMVALGVTPFLPGVVIKTVLLVAFAVTLDRLGPSWLKGPTRAPDSGDARA